MTGLPRDDRHWTTTWLEQDTIRRRAMPHDFEGALKALRVLQDAAIHASSDRAWRLQSDAVHVLREFVYERVTPDELRAAANRIRR